MAKIFDFSTGKIRAVDTSSTEKHSDPENSIASSPMPAPLEAQRKKNSPAIDRETYLLWLFSKDVDELLAKYILEFRLSSRELAAILSHRLGRLVSTTDDPEKLEEFCQAVLKRMALIDSNSSLRQQAEDFTNGKFTSGIDNFESSESTDSSHQSDVEEENGDKGA